MTHHLPIRVYYEDTDMAGIVYYANYLRYIERARSDWVREMGIDQLAMKAEGVVFAVRRVEADYIQPAVFDDMLDVDMGHVDHAGPHGDGARGQTRRCGPVPGGGYDCLYRGVRQTLSIASETSLNPRLAGGLAP